MRTTSSRVGAALALLVAVAGQAMAAPYAWTPAQIQSLGDVTAGFHGQGQISTINSITAIPNGIELSVTFGRGQQDDPFSPDFAATFARVSLAGGLGFPGLDISAFTGSGVSVTSSTGITVQSFVQTDFTENGTTIDDGDANPGEAFSFLFWEDNDSVAGGAPLTDAVFDFSSGSEFDGNWGVPSPSPVQGTNAIRQWGLQIAKFDGVNLGDRIEATIRIEKLVPEPSALAMAGLGGLGLAGLARRRSS